MKQDGGAFPNYKHTLCPDCHGEGRIPIGEHFVTHDMALDACEPSMEGMSAGIEYADCPRCGGGGLIYAEDAEWEGKDG